MSSLSKELQGAVKKKKNWVKESFGCIKAEHFDIWLLSEFKHFDFPALWNGNVIQNTQL